MLFSIVPPWILEEVRVDLKKKENGKNTGKNEVRFQKHQIRCQYPLCKHVQGSLLADGERNNEVIHDGRLTQRSGHPYLTFR